MDRFIVGKELFNASQSQGKCACFSIPSEGKTFCTTPEPAQLDRTYANLSDHLQREHTLVESRVALGHIVSGPLVQITKISGKFFRKHGFSRRGGTHFLYPEEAMHLAERGMLQIYDRGLPLSMEQLTNSLFSDAYSYACYLAYVHLVRHGFVVRRREPNAVHVDDIKKESSPSVHVVAIDRLSLIKAPATVGEVMSDANYVVVSPADITPILAENLKKCVREATDSETVGAVSPLKIVYNVYDERNADPEHRFSKNATSKPTFVLIVMQQGERGSYTLVNRQLLNQLGLPQKTKIVLATVDHGDLHFHSQQTFSVPEIKYI